MDTFLLNNLHSLLCQTAIVGLASVNKKRLTYVILYLKNTHSHIHTKQTQTKQEKKKKTCSFLILSLSGVYSDITVLSYQQTSHSFFLQFFDFLQGVTFPVNSHSQ
jgi:hypothetical protein